MGGVDLRELMAFQLPRLIHNGKFILNSTISTAACIWTEAKCCLRAISPFKFEHKVFFAPFHSFSCSLRCFIIKFNFIK